MLDELDRNASTPDSANSNPMPKARSRRNPRPEPAPQTGSMRGTGRTWPWSRRATLVGLALIALFLGTGVTAYRLYVDPQVAYLVQPEGPGAWVRPNSPFWIGINRDRVRAADFHRAFRLTAPLDNVQFHVRAFRRFELHVDGQFVYRSPDGWNDWKRVHDVSLGKLAAGDHEIRLRVWNRDGHPCVWAHVPRLQLSTDSDWLAAREGEPLDRALPVTETVQPFVFDAYPTVADCMARIWPWLAALFVLTFTVVWAAPRFAQWRWYPGNPAVVVRYVLLIAWIVLAANNLLKVPAKYGFDQLAHFEYVQYVADNGTLPIATEGWQMFQSPLFYLLAAPCYAVLSRFVDDPASQQWLRILPLLCGLLQIELVYRVARAVFPRQQDLQAVATLVGGLLPMHIYISQVIGNEPLAGCLSSATILMCILLLTDRTRPASPRFLAGLGALWGAALLAKVTPLMLGPLVVASVVVHARAQGQTCQRGLMRAAGVIGVALLVAGWYYLRNYAHLGTFFAGGWDPRSGNVWWQDPSYRTWLQLSSFGTALIQPVYSGCWSIWDGLYSSMWLDGFTSGRTERPYELAWNVHWMSAGAWLALVPVALLAVGGWRAVGETLRGEGGVLWFALAALGIYLAAFFSLYVQLPVYSTAKATYLVGLLPCFALLAAAGAAPLVRHALPRAILFAALVCWAVAAYCAYFVV